jgi:hypothetical protein
MTYEVVDNFAAGLDTRKSAITAPGGTLTVLRNAMITPGGEIAKRRAFVKMADVPSSFGLAATGGDIYIFGRNITPPAPTLTPDGDALAAEGIVIVRHLIPNAAAALKQTDFDIFDGKVYLACTTDATGTAANTPANNPHYFDRTETEGSGKGRYVRTVRTKVYSVSGRYLYFSAVDNPMVWDEEVLLNTVTVTNLSDATVAVCTVASADINQFANGMKVYISGASGTGMTNANGIHTVSSWNSPVNTFKIDANTSSATAAQTDGKVKATPCVNVTNVSNTNPTRLTVAVADINKFIDGQYVTVAGCAGLLAVANGKHKIYDVDNPVNTMSLSGVSTASAPAPQTTGVTVRLSSDVSRDGIGFINLGTQDADSESMTSLEVYYDRLALFSTESTQLWTINADPKLNQYEQLVRGAGTTAPRSALQYGSGDVLFLDASGVRSLKAKDSSNSASVSDIGSPVDPTIRQMRLNETKAFMKSAIAILEPQIGRFWMCFPDTILCLSYFPGPQITAWSVLDVPFTIEHVVTAGGYIFFRTTAFEIYVYGGANANTYDNCGVEVRLPYMNGKKPGHNKTYEALDFTIKGSWSVKVSYDFNTPDAEEDIGTFSESTWNNFRSELTGYASHISIRLYNNDAANAEISNLAVHYTIADEEQ